MIMVLPPTRTAEMPAPAQVRELYLAAFSEPPLNDGEEEADLYASVYAACLRDEEVTAVVAHDDAGLTGFAYGHRWSWAEQDYAWALSVRSRLGEAADALEGTQVLCLLARHPRVSGTGLGREVLRSWLDAVGASPCWLLTPDVDSPALRLYRAHGFVTVGNGPDDPAGRPALVLLRDTHPGSA